MATVNPAKMLLDELTCSVCTDYFKDPVSLDCGHNFCQACITQYWEGLRTNFCCPECRTTFSQRSFKPNRHLRNIVEASRTLTLEPTKEPEVGTVCEKHKRILDVFSNVTLDPDTAHPELVLSAGWRSVRRGHTRKALPNNPERFDTELCVLGSEGFTLGRHYWEVELEVEVEGRGHWSVGVARESVSRKGRISFNPERGIWAVLGCEDQCVAFTAPEQRFRLSLSRAPRRVGVYLDYEAGQVALFDAGSGDPIFTFPPASFAGERIRPFFRVGLWGPGCQLTLSTQSTPPPIRTDRAEGGVTL
uniref:Uncharacterized protein n=1 Tax=Terrapene triunguis TaxID=2587831 RepID=A0A674ISH5_9SAUR